MKIKRAIVNLLDKACCWFHFITHHRPWLWLPQKPGWFALHCPLASISFKLAERWNIDLPPGEETDD